MEYMSDKELVTVNIDRYMDLQRILMADDPKKEARNQFIAVKAKLEASGVVVENLTME